MASLPQITPLRKTECPSLNSCRMPVTPLLGVGHFSHLSPSCWDFFFLGWACKSLIGVVTMAVSSCVHLPNSVWKAFFPYRHPPPPSLTVSLSLFHDDLWAWKKRCDLDVLFRAWHFSAYQTKMFCTMRMGCFLIADPHGGQVELSTDFVGNHVLSAPCLVVHLIVWCLLSWEESYDTLPFLSFWMIWSLIAARILSICLLNWIPESQDFLFLLLNPASIFACLCNFWIFWAINGLCCILSLQPEIPECICKQTGNSASSHAIWGDKQYLTGVILDKQQPHR